MANNTPVQIEAAANGFIVKPGERDTNCAFSSSSMFVFNEFEKLADWLRNHFGSNEAFPPLVKNLK